jgi:hypothetical protein
VPGHAYLALAGNAGPLCIAGRSEPGHSIGLLVRRLPSQRSPGAKSLLCLANAQLGGAVSGNGPSGTPWPFPPTIGASYAPLTAANDRKQQGGLARCASASLQRLTTLRSEEP